MPLEAATEKITLMSRENGENIQILTEGDMIAPDINPDIYRILKTDENVIIDKIKAEQGRISFSGRLVASVLYYGRKTDHPISSMKSEFPIEDYIVADNINEDTKADIIPEIIHTDYRLVNDRKVNVKAVTGIKVCKTDSSTVDAVKTVSGSDALQSKVTTVDFGNVDERIDENFMVKEELKLPSGKPDIAEILETSAEICHREIRSMASAVQVKGDFKICVMYITSDEEYSVDSAEFMLPFNGSIDVSGADSDTMCLVRMKPVSLKSDIEADENGAPRIITVEITVGAVVKAFAKRPDIILEDAYSLSSQLDITKIPADYIEIFGRNCAQGMFRGSVNIENGQPHMLQIIKACGAVRGVKTEISDNIANICGIADIRLIYIANDDNMPINVVETAIPFSQDVEIKGITDEANADVVVEIEDISFTMLSENEAEIRITVSFDVVASSTKSCEIITGVKESDKPCEYPVKGSAVIYTVKKGDTLWSIAKEFHTTVDDIVELNKNKIDNPDLIYPGQRLLILKKFV